MRTFALRNYVFALFFGSLVAACSSGDGGTSSGGTSSGDTSSGGTSSGGTSSGGASSGDNASGGTEQNGTGSVTLSRGSTEVVSYDVKNARATLDGNEIHFELLSDDTKHVVNVSIHGTATGTYEVGGDLGDGRAGILMYSDDALPNASEGTPGLLTGEGGTVILTQAEGRAVGTFDANAQIDDEGYRVQGTFDLPIAAGGGE